MAPKGSQNPTVYTAIKRDLMEGQFSPGQRLDGATLATRHATSMTPVRMALSRLVGERLVEVHANDGYHAVTTTQTGIIDLYRFNGQVLDLCVLLAASDGVRDQQPAFVLDEAPVEAATHLFASIASHSRSAELMAVVRGLNDRLHLIRRLELTNGQKAGAELEGLADLWSTHQIPLLRAELAAYHHRRIEQAGEILKMMYVPKDS